jgi:hypothetical protein
MRGELDPRAVAHSVQFVPDPLDDFFSSIGHARILANIANFAIADIAKIA